ncbi:MAG: hypothetical protein ACT4NL_13155 [Pseudomarimonas sp.]
MRSWLFVIAGLVAALYPATAFCAPVPTVQLLDFATGEKAAQPSVTVDAREGFVLTWQERAGTTNTLRYAVIDPEGIELRRGTVASGPDWFINGADFPNLVVLDNGDWVTFWLQKTSPDTYSYAIHSIRSRDAGRHWDPPILLNRDATHTEHGFVSLTAAGDDRVRAVWLDGRRMADAAAASTHDHAAAEHMTLRTAVLGRDVAATDERELDDLTCACCQTDAVRGSQRTAVVYRDRSATEIRDIAWLSVQNDRWSASKPLHDDGWKITGCPVNGPAIAADGDRFAVIWPSMASGDMRIAFKIDDAGESVDSHTLAEGAAELARLDIARFANEQWLVSRVVTESNQPTLRVSLIGERGDIAWQQDIANKVGGFPRLASSGKVAMVVWAEAGDSPTHSRVGMARLSMPAAKPN